MASEALFSSTAPNGLKVDPEDLERRKRPESVPIAEYYETPRLAQEIHERGSKQVAFQFPEYLLSDSADVLWDLEDKLAIVQNDVPLLFVLGDTAYGEASVDQIAAEHLETDLIVHFGPTTFAPVAGRIPVIHIYGVHPFNQQVCIDELQRELCDSPDKPLIFVYDSLYAHNIGAVTDELSKAHTLRVGRLPDPTKTSEAPGELVAFIGGLEVHLPATDASTAEQQEEDETVDQVETALTSHNVVYIGSTGWQLTSVLMRCAECDRCVMFDPTTGVASVAQSAQRDLKRRYYLIQRTKQASVIGVVVATLGVKHYQSVVDYCTKIIDDSGRKAYTLAVGTPNVAKLTNFAEIEAYVLVASAETTLLDSRDFPVPLVTPLELEIALGLRQWDGFYSTDFSSLQFGGEEPQQPTREEDDTPEFSLVSSQLEDRRAMSSRSKKVELEMEGNDSKCTTLIQHSSPAAQYLLQRSYQGLEQRLGEDQPHLAKEGREGIASDYGQR